MKKSFTLIEVMIATVIVLIASFAILSMSTNSKHLFEIISKNNAFKLKATILLNDHNGSNLYEDLIDFNITNDEIIKTLKKEKINYKIISDDTHKISEFKLTQKIKKIQIYNKTNQIIIYNMEIK